MSRNCNHLVLIEQIEATVSDKVAPGETIPWIVDPQNVESFDVINVFLNGDLLDQSSFKVNEGKLTVAFKLFKDDWIAIWGWNRV